MGLRLFFIYSVSWTFTKSFPTSPRLRKNRRKGSLSPNHPSVFLSFVALHCIKISSLQSSTFSDLIMILPVYFLVLGFWMSWMKVLFFAPTISPIVVLQMPISSEPSFPSSSRTSKVTSCLHSKIFYQWLLIDYLLNFFGWILQMDQTC